MEGACVKGACVEGACVEGACVEGASVEGASVEGASACGVHAVCRVAALPISHAIKPAALQWGACLHIPLQ